jgi:hypothetical protein
VGDDGKIVKMVARGGKEDSWMLSEAGVSGAGDSWESYHGEA